MVYRYKTAWHHTTLVVVVLEGKARPDFIELNGGTKWNASIGSVVMQRQQVL
jgi:hypothetical protein